MDGGILNPDGCFLEKLKLGAEEVVAPEPAHNCLRTPS
jgi:hypothetical protein